MLKVYLKGENFRPSELKSKAFFENIKILTEKGEMLNFGFKKNPVAKFGLANLTFINKKQESVDKFLFDNLTALKKYRSLLFKSNVQTISLIIIVKTRS